MLVFPATDEAEIHEHLNWRAQMKDKYNSMNIN